MSCIPTSDTFCLLRSFGSCSLPSFSCPSDTYFGPQVSGTAAWREGIGVSSSCVQTGDEGCDPIKLLLHSTAVFLSFLRKLCKQPKLTSKTREEAGAHSESIDYSGVVINRNSHKSTGSRQEGSTSLQKT